jgi:hypothetical protein
MLSDDWVFHAGLAVEGGYDTNVFYTGSDGDSAGAGRLRITPQLEIATLPPQRRENPDGTATETGGNVDFSFTVAGVYNEYLTADDGPLAETVRNQRDFGILSDINLVVFPRRTWSFLLSNHFMRTVEPDNVPVRDTYGYNRDFDEALLGVRWAPGGGAFETTLRAGVTLNFYEEGGEIGRIGNYVSPRLMLDGRWKFFPNTALTFNTDFSPVFREDEPSQAGFPISSSYPIRAWVGMTGQWTPLISTQLRIGYGAGLYTDGPDFDSALAQAEVSFILGPAGKISVGFVRDFVDSIFSNFYARNEGYARWDQMFAGAFMVGLEFRVGYLQYAELYETGGAGGWTSSTDGAPNPRNDVRLGGGVFLEYRLRDWIAFNATVRYDQTVTDFRWTDPTAATAAAEDWWKLTAFLGVRAMY